MTLVTLFDLKFLHEIAAGAVGTSNRRHWLCGFSFIGALKGMQPGPFLNQDELFFPAPRPQ
jgi:hypothetical protein